MLVASQCRFWTGKFNFIGNFAVDCSRRSGGLLLLWREPLDISIKSYSLGHIDCIVKYDINEWRFTGFYGNPIASLRKFSWQLLRRLAGLQDLKHLPWVVGGDFNEILFENEKLGGAVRSINQMKDFSSVLDDCFLKDMGDSGEAYTWCNKRKGGAVIFERLDRFLCNIEWKLIYPTAEVVNLDFFGSDHRPINLVLKPLHNVNSRRYPKRFTFEQKWLLEEEFSNLVPCWWGSMSKEQSIAEKLLQCSKNMKVWAGERFNQMDKRISRMKKDLNAILKSPNAKNNFSQIGALEKDIEKLISQEEMHWKQRSRVNWLRFGDRNTKYFHATASSRRKTNFIEGLKDANGDWCIDLKGMEDITLAYFTELFSSSNPSQQAIEAATVHIEPVVDQSLNAVLCEPFTESEVRKAVFDMHPSKAPGPDGFSAIFYQKFWSVIGQDITSAVLTVLNGNGDISSWNSTLVVLIPKIQKPVTLKDFRPISLCNVCYKIISRAITNRLRQVLDRVVDQYQSAFIPKRLILDNVVVGFECMHWIRNNRKAKNGFAALKLDMSKAYDRVEWGFLHAIMLKLGFAEKWVNLIMKCVTTVNYSFRINQNVVGDLTPQRGLRQGDPLSPYLFTICAQGLSSIFSKAMERHLFRGVKIANSCPMISHLFFADDSLIFFKATRDDCIQVRNCLHIYEQASGQMVNYDKSELSFSPSTSPQVIDAIKNILSISVVLGHNMYLGLPTFSLRNKRLQFAYLRERISHKTNGWSARFFSPGGREVLIKSVLQAIPSYAMSCFRIPDVLCKDLDQLCARFWWNDKQGKKGLHWLNWDSLCRPKCAGGMGFRKMAAFNKALLAKQVWRVIQFPNSLMARVLKGRYFKDVDIMKAKLGTNPSFVWRSILGSRDLIHKKLCWRVGDGQKISASNEPWIPDIPNFTSRSNRITDQNIMVASLITQQGSWDELVIRQQFMVHEAEIILGIPLNRKGCEDSRYWSGSDNGIYSVKKGYALENSSFSPPPNQSCCSNRDWWKIIWGLNLPPKVKIFLWKASLEILPTNANLKNHHVPTSGMCPLCYVQLATTSHCLLFCSHVRMVWKNSGIWCLFKQFIGAPFVFCGWVMYKSLCREDFELFAMVLWALWSDFCKSSHGLESRPQSVNFSWAGTLAGSFRLANEKMEKTVSDLLVSKVQRWQPPCPNHLRLDVDAGFQSKHNLFCIGAIIRNSLGQVIGVKTCFIYSNGAVKGAELLAIRLGMDVCLNRGFSNISIFSDSVQAVRAALNPEEDVSPNGTIAQEIHSLLKTNPNAFLSLKHMSRSANRAAHCLVRKSLLSRLEFEWYSDDSLPSWLMDIVNNDISISS